MQNQKIVSAQETEAIAKEGFEYGYPLVLMDVSRAVMTAPGKGHGPNRFTHLRTFPDASFTDVVSPNADTLYSTAWLDLGAEPIVLSVPDTEGRYYLMPMLSGWTDVFAAPGKRTTGTSRADFVIVGPKWKGALPEGLEVLRAPTEMVWLLGRTQTDGPDDYEAVHALQDQYVLTPLSVWQGAGAPHASGRARNNIDSQTPPVDQVARMDAVTFFSRLARLLWTNPPQQADNPIIEKLARIGVRPGAVFETDPAQKRVLDRAIKSALDGLLAALRQSSAQKGTRWTLLRGLGAYGTDYHKRALVALGGLGANLDADAMYPHTTIDANGNALNGAHRYRIHFEPGKLPPARAFWSLTMYDDKQFFAANPIDRYALGDRNDLQQNADGSLDLFIQHTSPGQHRESNWLPAPNGNFSVILRLYWPDQAMLDGSWLPPALERLDATHPERQMQPPESWRKLREQEGVA